MLYFHSLIDYVTFYLPVFTPFFFQMCFHPFSYRHFSRICSSPVTTFSTVPNLFWPSAFLTRMLMWITHSNILNCMHQDFPVHFSTNESSSKAPYKDLSPVVFFFSLVTVRQPHLFIWWGHSSPNETFCSKIDTWKNQINLVSFFFFCQKKII